MTEEESSPSNVIEEDLSSRDLLSLPPESLNGHVETLLIDYNNIEQLPDDFGTCMNSLRCFSCIGNNLKTLPDSFGTLAKLTEIYLNENGLEKLPGSFCRLQNLVKLKLTGNQLEVLPDEFGQLESLEILECDENELTKLPKTFGCLEKLKILELGSNHITVLSEGFGMLKSLEVLNLSSNKLMSLPESFGNLPNLKTVDLSANNIKCLPSCFKSCHSLLKMYAASNLLQGLPDWVSDLECIIEFSVKDNQFQHQPLPDSFPPNCSRLKYLDMSGNFMSKLPVTLGELSCLEYLHFGSVIGELERRNFQNGNWLAELPDSICQLENLKELHVDENQLNYLPADFGDLVSLEILDVGQNMLRVLPDSFGNLHKLRVCMLSKNHLMWLPSNFGDLSSLEDLRLDGNELRELPESFSKLTTLKTLDLFSNHLMEIPAALHHLTNLVRLDLECNDFQLPLSDIPQIVTRSKYPDRDPNLKDNWRGRPRQDLSKLDNIIKAPEYGPLEDFEPPPPDLNYSEDFLVAAMKSNMSIWRSHTDPSSRRQPTRRRFQRRHYDSGSGQSDSGDYVCNGFNEEEEDSSGTDYDNMDEDDEDDDYEPPVYVRPTEWSGMNKNSLEVNEGTHVNVHAMLESAECWDEEVDANAEQFAESTTVHPTKLYYAPIDNGEFTFTPFDIHVQNYIKRPEKYVVEDGQFENCDIDTTTELQVDPVF